MACIMAWSWHCYNWPNGHSSDSENDRGMGVRSMGLAGVGAADIVAVDKGMVCFGMVENGLGLVSGFCVEASMA
jgi:hypothetical protein